MGTNFDPTYSLNNAVSFIAELLYTTIKEGNITDEERDTLINIANTFKER